MDQERALERPLAGQVAIVAGAGRGIGRAIARTLAGEGMAVMLVARTEDELRSAEKEIRAAGGHAEVTAGDVSEPGLAPRLVTTTEQLLGPVDLLVNSAGVAGADAVFWDADPDAWWRVVEINLRGPMLCAQAVLPGMVARRRGRIVNVASRAGARSHPLPSYAVAASAVFRLTDNVAFQSGENGVLTIAIGPGHVRTDLARRLDDAAGVRRDEHAWTDPQAAADLVLRVARGELDALSGRFVDVADDVDAMIARAEEIQRDGLHQIRLVKLDRELEPLGVYRR